MSKELAFQKKKKNSYLNIFYKTNFKQKYSYVRSVFQKYNYIRVCLVFPTYSKSQRVSKNTFIGRIFSLAVYIVRRLFELVVIGDNQSYWLTKLVIGGNHRWTSQLKLTFGGGRWSSLSMVIIKDGH